MKTHNEVIYDLSKSNEDILWENDKFYVTWFPNGNRWLLYRKGRIYPISQCLSKKVWEKEYKSNPEIYCKKYIERRIRGIDSQLGKIVMQAYGLVQEKKMLTGKVI